MSLSEDLRLFRDKVAKRSQAVFLGSVDAVHGSVVEGSEISGAPGQPVDTGNLVNSWQQTFPEELVGQTATGVEYAPAVEAGQQAPYTTPSGAEVTPRPMQFRSSVGGAHSVKLTRAAWARIVEAVVRKVVP